MRHSSIVEFQSADYQINLWAITDLKGLVDTGGCRGETLLLFLRFLYNARCIIEEQEEDSGNESVPLQIERVYRWNARL